MKKHGLGVSILLIPRSGVRVPDSPPCEFERSGKASGLFCCPRCAHVASPPRKPCAGTAFSILASPRRFGYPRMQMIPACTKPTRPDAFEHGAPCFPSRENPRISARTFQNRERRAPELRRATRHVLPSPLICGHLVYDGGSICNKTLLRPCW